MIVARIMMNTVAMIGAFPLGVTYESMRKNGKSPRRAIV